MVQAAFRYVCEKPTLVASHPTKWGMGLGAPKNPVRRNGFGFLGVYDFH